MNLPAEGPRPRQNAELSFLLKFPVGESARRSRNGKSLVKSPRACGRTLRIRSASPLHNKYATKLAEHFLSMRESKSCLGKATIFSGADQYFTPTANSQLPTARPIFQESFRKSVGRRKESSTFLRGVPSNSI